MPACGPARNAAFLCASCAFAHVYMRHAPRDPNTGSSDLSGHVCCWRRLRGTAQQPGPLRAVPAPVFFGSFKESKPAGSRQVRIVCTRRQIPATQGRRGHAKGGGKIPRRLAAEEEKREKAQGCYSFPNSSPVIPLRTFLAVWLPVPKPSLKT